jgi:hypothetical protein
MLSAGQLIRHRIPPPTPNKRKKETKKNQPTPPKHNAAVHSQTIVLDNRTGSAANKGAERRGVLTVLCQQSLSRANATQREHDAQSGPKQTSPKQIAQMRTKHVVTGWSRLRDGVV